MNMEPMENDLKSAGPAIHEYWAMIRRRKYYAFVAMVAVWVVFAVAALRLPNIYLSEITILVEPPKVSTTYVQPIFTSRIEDRLSTIKEQIKSRTNLERIIQEYHLYNWKGPGPVPEATVQAMRKDISITVSGNSSFRVAYESRKPEAARIVVNRLAAFFIDENLRAREVQTASTSEFLETQLEEARKRLENQEASLKDYKLRHMGELPEQTSVIMKTLDRLQFQLQASVDATQRAQERKLFNERQLAALSPEASVSPVTAWPSEIPAAIATPEDPAVIQLRTYQATLADLSTRYKEDYPDIVQLKKKIANLERRITSTPEPTTVSGSHVTEATRMPDIRPISPLARETKRRASELRGEIESLDNQLRQRAREQADLRSQLAYYQGKVDLAPKLEQELTGLLRDYDITKGNYKSLLEKKLSSETAENLEHKQKGEQFRIIDPAMVPEHPIRPNRWMIFLSGLLLGPVFGAALAWGRDLLDQSVHTEADAERRLGAPVLATVPEIVVTRSHDDAPWYSVPQGSRLDLTTRNRSYMLQESMRTAGAEMFFGQNQNADGARKLVLLTDPWSLASEQYRLLGLHVLSAQQRFDHRSLLITSAGVNEGKTLAAMNLALTLVRERSVRVLIVDADLRKAGLNSFIPQKPMQGLADLLEGSGDYATAILPTPLSGLSILPAGAFSFNPVGQLGSPRMTDLVRRWEQDFDLVLIDSPPLLPVPDGLILSQLASRTLLVVRANQTPYRAVKKAMEGIAPEKRLGILLNFLKEFSVRDHYYKQYYGRVDGHVPVEL